MQLLSRCVSFDGQVHVPSVYCASKGMVTVMLWRCQSAIVMFKGFLNHQSLGYCMWCKPKSYNRGYVRISVFPVFWKYLPMILVQELLMTVSVAYIDSPCQCTYMLYMQAMTLTKSYRL